MLFFYNGITMEAFVFLKKKRCNKFFEAMEKPEVLIAL
jgi:hypothetical protein